MRFNTTSITSKSSDINADYENGSVIYIKLNDLQSFIESSVAFDNMKYYYTVRYNSDVWKWVGKKYPNEDGVLVKNIYGYLPCGLYLDGPFSYEEILSKYSDYSFTNIRNSDYVRIYGGDKPRTRLTPFNVNAYTPYLSKENSEPRQIAVSIFAPININSSINDLANYNAFITKENPLQPVWILGRSEVINPNIPLIEQNLNITNQASFLFFKQSAITNYISSLGIPFTYDLDEAINGDPPTPEPPVIPPIPFPDVDPDNIGEGLVPEYDKETTDGLLGPAKLSQFFMAYNPTDPELRQIAAKFWSQNILDTDQILKIMANPAEAVLTCMRVPYQPSSSQSLEKPFYFTYGPGIQFDECPTAVVQKQYEVFNFGEIIFEPFFENFMDYSPYTKIQLYVPFIGFMPIIPEEWIGYTMNLTYVIDNITGAFQVIVKRLSIDIEQVVGTYSGKMGFSIPITSFNYGNILSAIATTVTAAATAGFSSFNAIATKSGNIGKSISKQEEKLATIDVSSKSGQSKADRISSNIDKLKGTQSQLQKSQITTPLASAASASYNKVLSQPNLAIDIARSGSLSSELGHMNYLEPYVIITRVNPDVPLEYNQYFGRPCNKYLPLSSLTGFTVFDNIHLDGVVCTEDEKNLIDKFLKSGVIL